MGPRAALVTGGSSGIGKALARVLGQEGYGVTIGGRDEVKLVGTAAELRREGIAVEPVAGDLADEEAIGRLVEARATRTGAWTRSSTRRPTAAAGSRWRGCRPRCSTAISTSTCGPCSSPSAPRCRC
jgi:NAD(P)-dependent dehydrogenase (short-subunit alcohol dehydrogenase family)